MRHKKVSCFLIALIIVLQIATISAGAENVKIKINQSNGLITLIGSDYLLLSGAAVNLVAFKPDKSFEDIVIGNKASFLDSIASLRQANVGEDGSFIFEFIANGGYGIYDITITDKDGNEIFTGQREYLKDALKSIIMLVNGAASIEELENIIEDNKETLGISFELLNNIKNKEFIYRELFNARPYTVSDDSDEITERFNRKTFVQGVNECGTTQEVFNVIKANSEILNLNEDIRCDIFFNKFSMEEILEVCTLIMAQKPEEGYSCACSIIDLLDNSILELYLENNFIGTAYMEQFLKANNDIFKIDFTEYEKLKNKNVVLKNMSNSDLKILSDIKIKFDEYVNDQKQEENNQRSGESRVHSGSGGGGRSTVVISGDAVKPIEKPVIEPKQFFDDLNGFEWAKESIDYLALRKFVNGYNGKFYPEKTITREEFVKLLVSTFGLMDETAECTLEDVKKTEWYYHYVASAVKLGLVNGVEEGLFGISNKITREEMAVMAYRFAVHSGIVTESDSPQLNFTDKDTISVYAIKAISGFVNAGILSGMEDGRFAAKESVQRGQAAVLLHRLHMMLN